MELKDLDAQLKAIGKAAILYAPAWDFDSNLFTTFEHLGFTEGDNEVTMNETTNELTMTEYTGDAPHEAYIQGEAPVASLSLFTADPSLRSILSPTGGASGGRKRQQPVVKYTLALIPEALFLDITDPTSQEDVELVATGTSWTAGGSALNAAQEALLGQSAFLWRGYFSKPPLAYRHADGGKSVDQVTFTLMYQVAAPNGHRLYTLGDPYDAGIDITTGIVPESS